MAFGSPQSASGHSPPPIGAITSTRFALSRSPLAHPTRYRRRPLVEVICPRRYLLVGKRVDEVADPVVTGILFVVVPRRLVAMVPEERERVVRLPAEFEVLTEVDRVHAAGEADVCKALLRPQPLLRRCPLVPAPEDHPSYHR